VTLCKVLVPSLGQESCDAQTRSRHGGIKKCRTNVDQSLMGFRDLDTAIFSWLLQDSVVRNLSGFIRIRLESNGRTTRAA
jgi:hypothetical protein